MRGAAVFAVPAAEMAGPSWCQKTKGEKSKMRMPKDHWIYAVPKAEDLDKPVIAGSTIFVRLAVRDALRAAFQRSTNSGQVEDFDVDAVVIDACNIICGFGGPEQKARVL